jgi:hypothetical protein
VQLHDGSEWFQLPAGVEQFEREIQNLIDRMVPWVGPTETRKIFTKFAKTITRTDMAADKNFGILHRYDLMVPEPNQNELARQLSKERRVTESTALQRIKDWRAKRKAAIANGTWDGPPLWDRKLNSYAFQKGMIQWRL